MAKKAKRKPTQIQLDYKREVNRIKRAVKHLESEGYRLKYPLNTIIGETKRPTRKKIVELSRITPERLRAKSTALDVSGHIVSGTRAYEERQHAKREQRKWLKTPAGREFQRQQQNEEWHRKRREQDRLDRERAKRINEGTIIMDSVYELIQYYDTIGGKYLQNLLQSEIRQYGEQAVARAMAQLPFNVVEEAQNLIFYFEKMDADAGHRAFKNFADAIRGTIMTDGERREMGNVMDAMSTYEEPD